MNTVLFIGITGALLLLIAFALNQFKYWESNDLVYDVCNFIGGSFLVYNAYMTDAWPFLILNLVWTLVSINDIHLDIKDLQKGRTTFKWIHHRRK